MLYDCGVAKALCVQKLFCAKVSLYKSFCFLPVHGTYDITCILSTLLYCLIMFGILVWFSVLMLPWEETEHFNIYCLHKCPFLHLVGIWIKGTLMYAPKITTNDNLPGWQLPPQQCWPGEYRLDCITGAVNTCRFPWKSSIQTFWRI